MERDGLIDGQHGLIFHRVFQGTVLPRLVLGHPYQVLASRARVRLPLEKGIAGADGVGGGVFQDPTGSDQLQRHRIGGHYRFAEIVAGPGAGIAAWGLGSCQQQVEAIGAVWQTASLHDLADQVVHVKPAALIENGFNDPQFQRHRLASVGSVQEIEWIGRIFQVCIFQPQGPLQDKWNGFHVEELVLKGEPQSR